MKKILQFAVIILIIMTLIPLISVSNKGQIGNAAKSTKEEDTLEQGYDSKTTIKVLMQNNGEICEMSLRDYLIGVVAGEMPALFKAEALKAQAVAARSYTLNKIDQAKNNPAAFPTHKGADACTDPTHCKAYLSQSDAQKLWGNDKFDQYYNAIKSAVDKTCGEVATYDGKPICAVFHSTSSGMTESAQDIWGSDVPYLKSVFSQGDTLSPKYKTQDVFDIATFKATIEKNFNNIKLSDESEKWIGEEKRTLAGSVKEIVIGGTSVSGDNIRSAFSLNSSNFSIKLSDGLFVFDVVGYGHGVGMSQYGAEYMAEQGKSYADILKWYYSGISITKLE